ncbi:MAG: DUF2070 family protein [Thaumarchaeota archaeon]|nr:DUF2070 family protein [Nitrososphaerota archaeon]
MTPSSDYVSRIHKRYSLTLINPSSFYHSLIASVIIVLLLVITTNFQYLQDYNILFGLFGVIAVLLSTQYIDSRLIKHQEYSKAIHMSLFGNAIWLLVILVGLLSVTIFSKPETSLFYITEGMFLFASFRIGLLTTTLGTSLRKAWLICFIQPLAMFLVLIPQNMWVSTLADPETLVYGFTFLIIASAWSVLTDKAGRPGVKSTHKVIQAYLASIGGKNLSEVETMIAESSKPSNVSTSQIRFSSYDKETDFRLILPDIHPGPYHPVGGSNIPYLIYKKMNSSAMVLHSVSDHSLNLPSQQEVDNYLMSLVDSTVFQEGLSCTEPVVVQINKARVTGMLFGKISLLFLSLSPHGMEDLPSYIKKEIEQFSKNRKFERVMVVDCHNAMGREISKIDSEDMIKAAKSCLDSLIAKKHYQFVFGYANSDEMNLSTPDLGLGGLGVLCLKINEKKYFLAWADANNLENGVREHVVNHFSKNGYTLLEICTSDTHYTQTKVRTRMGYYQFGVLTKIQKIADWYLKLAKIAEKNMTPAKFEILEKESNVRIMGPTIIQNYSTALDKSMKISKGFMIGSFILFIISMI